MVTNYDYSDCNTNGVSSARSEIRRTNHNAVRVGRRREAQAGLRTYLPALSDFPDNANATANNNSIVVTFWKE